MKMHGLGNDFVVIDTRGADDAQPMTPALASALADRRRGVGFDQLALIDHSPNEDFALTFYNADGSTAGACGNATRCIARREMDLTGKTTLRIRTERGQLAARDDGAGITAINMGHPALRWDAIPLAEDVDTLSLPIEGAPVATNMGNPHCTFFVEDAEAVDLETFGHAHEHHPLFPQRTNVQVVQRLSDCHLRMRVWERGVGLTLASGSSSCAVVVAAARRGLTGRAVRVTLDGGDLNIDWRDDGVWMTGPTAHVFDGVLTATFLRSVT